MEKKKMKSFFTLDRRASDGFTLVELIVVIAILAILGGVAVPAYSGYVKKANMQADITLASEVVHGLTLYYYNNNGNVTGGSVVLSTSGATAEGEAAEAMKMTFGENWSEVAKLKYNGWTNDGLLSLVSGYEKEDAELIFNSTFLTKSNAENMLDATNSLLNLAAQKIMNTTNASKYLEDLGGTLGQTVADLKLDPESEEYGTAVSNLLVSHFADAMSSDEALEGDTNSISKLVTYYATIYAYCQEKNDNTLIEALNEELMNASYEDLTSANNKTYFGAKLQASDNQAIKDLYKDYARNFATNTAKTDEQALNKMMEAVSLIAGGYTDKESLTNKNLYASDGAILDQVNTYISAVGAIASGVTLPNVQAGEVAVVLFADGSISSTIRLA